MVKTHASQWNYAFPWSQVVTAFWQKNPNPYTAHVLSEDVYDRKLTDDQMLITKRLLTKTNKLPRWGERLFFRGSGATIAFIIEESICDLKEKVFTTITKNINLKSLMVVEETCTYRPDDNNPSGTICMKKVVATSELFGFKTTLEAFAIQRYKKNQEVASLGLEYIIHKLFLPQATSPSAAIVKSSDSQKFPIKQADKTKTFLQKPSNDSM